MPFSNRSASDRKFEKAHYEVFGVSRWKLASLAISFRWSAFIKRSRRTLERMLQRPAK